MKLYLVRHGDAMPMLDDDARPLSEQGKGEAKNLARFLKLMLVKPRFIFHSTLSRSHETALLIAEGLGCPHNLQERKGLRPEDETDAWVLELEAASEHCVIVGHLPFLPALASRLLTGSEDGFSFKFPTGSVVCLEREGYGGWFLRHFVTTKIIKAIFANT